MPINLSLTDHKSSSLEKVADQAGMKRPIIRHYVGNRDDLILALTERVGWGNFAIKPPD